MTTTGGAEMHVLQLQAGPRERDPTLMPSWMWDEVGLAYEWTSRALHYVNCGGEWGEDMGADPRSVLLEVEALFCRMRFIRCDVPDMASHEVDPLGFLIASQAFLSGLVVRH